MQPLDDKAQQAMEMMTRVKRRVYSCTVVCLLLIGPMVYLVYLWDSRWGGLVIGSLLVVAPMAAGYLEMRRILISYKKRV